MKQRFYIYQRRDTFYLQDSRTGKQQSLNTKNRNEASRLLEIKRQSAADPGFNQLILKTCLSAQDPLLSKRTWATVMEQMARHGKDSTRNPCTRAMQSRAFDGLRPVKLFKTTAEDFLAILNGGKVSVGQAGCQSRERSPRFQPGRARLLKPAPRPVPPSRR